MWSGTCQLAKTHISSHFHIFSSPKILLMKLSKAANAKPIYFTVFKATTPQEVLLQQKDLVSKHPGKPGLESDIRRACFTRSSKYFLNFCWPCRPRKKKWRWIVSIIHWFGQETQLNTYNVCRHLHDFNAGPLLHLFVWKAPEIPRRTWSISGRVQQQHQHEQHLRHLNRDIRKIMACSPAMATITRE